MKLTKYIATQAFLETVNIRNFEFSNVVKIVEDLLDNKIMSNKRWNELSGYKTEEASSLYDILNYIGLVEKVGSGGIESTIYTLTNFGKFLLDKKRISLEQQIAPFFLNWLPLKIFLKYIQENPGTGVDEIKVNLGMQIAEHINDIANIVNSSLIRTSNMPFSRAILEKVLVKIAVNLGFVQADKNYGPYYLSPIGKYMVKSIDYQNFKFRIIDSKLKPVHLALMDFIDRGFTEIIVYGDTSEIEGAKVFFDIYTKRIGVPHTIKTVYKKKSINAVISTNSAILQTSPNFVSYTNDQVKVIELVSTLMNIE